VSMPSGTQFWVSATVNTSSVRGAGSGDERA
jgi:hypothetical protein